MAWYNIGVQHSCGMSRILGRALAHRYENYVHVHCENASDLGDFPWYKSAAYILWVDPLLVFALNSHTSEDHQLVTCGRMVLCHQD